MRIYIINISFVEKSKPALLYAMYNVGKNKKYFKRYVRMMNFV